MIYIVIGAVALVLGTIGVIIPVLPTTPFLLIASFCFVKGSKKIDRWFRGSKIYKKHLENFVEKKAMTLKQKISILLVADMMIAIPIVLVDNTIMRVSLVLVMLVKAYYFIFKIQTIKCVVENEKGLD